MRSPSLALAALSCIALASSLRADSLCHPDQSNDSQPPLQGYTLPGGATIGQEFKPLEPSLDAVELAVNRQGPGASGDVFARIRDLSPGGTILGTSEVVTVQNTSPVTRARFRFETPVPLVPGGIHFIEVVHAGGADVGVFLSGGFGSDLYPDGTAYFNGASVPGDDLWFRTGSIDPMQLVDQANEGMLLGTTSLAGGVAQEFKPLDECLDAVELQVAGTGTCRVRIFEGSLGGRTLGVSEVVEITVLGPGITRPRFVFAQPVPLTPGAVHVLEVAPVSGGPLGAGFTADGYADGNALLGGVPVPANDLWFRVGNVQESLAVTDQLNEDPLGAPAILPGLAPVGQEFVPALDSLQRIELRLSTVDPLIGEVFVRVRETGITGAVLGTSPLVAIRTQDGPEACVRFDFDPPAPLEPGALHVLEVVHASGGDVNVYTTGVGNDAYAAGRILVSGAAVADTDLWFRLGLICEAIPVPYQTNEVLSNDGVVIDAGTPVVGQEFTTSTNATQVVELRMTPVGVSPGSAFIRIRSGGIGGAIRGTSQTVTIDSQSTLPATRPRFEFSPPVSLLNGSPYVIEVVHAGGGPLGVFTSGSGVDSYAGGSAIVGGVPVTEDLWFREGLKNECVPPPDPRFCYGVGCPCGNDFPGAGCRNSTGVGALLSTTGSASVAADDLVLVATGFPPLNSGLYFMGPAVFGPLFVGDGLGCTGGLFRFLPGTVDGTGTFTITNLVAQAPAGTILSGDTRYFQAWTRDVLCGPPPVPCPSPCMLGSNLSNGYGVTFEP